VGAQIFVWAPNLFGGRPFLVSGQFFGERPFFLVSGHFLGERPIAGRPNKKNGRPPKFLAATQNNRSINCDDMRTSQIHL
jgi:hypothetical protein